MDKLPGILPPTATEETSRLIELGVLLPCSHCGVYTGNFCDGVACENRKRVGLPYIRICPACEASHRVCKLCKEMMSPRTKCFGREHLIIVEGESRSCAYCAMQNCSLRCSRCNLAFYCDVACQKKDFKRHKVLTCVNHEDYRKDKVFVEKYTKDMRK